MTKRNRWHTTCLLPGGALLLGAVVNQAASAADVPAAMPVKAQVQSLDQRWTATFNEETQYYSWQSSQGYPHLPLQFPGDPRGQGSGSQVYNPFGLQIDGKPSDDWQVQFLVRSGYIWSRQNTGGVSGESSSPTDTTFGGTVTYNGIAGIQPFASLNVNAPTGTTVLPGNTAFARPDPDLAGVPTFGEGWNVGPTIGVNIPITATLVGVLSAGYTYRGDYNREGPVVLGVQGTNRLTPGNTWTLNSALAYQANGLSLQVSGSFTAMSQTSIDGLALYRTGDSIAVSGSAGYVWNPSWSSQVTASFTHTNRNLEPIVGLPPPPMLAIEPFNSNSNVTQLLLSTTYTQGSLSLGPTLRYTYRDRNDWDPTSATFLPAKTSWALGGMAQFAVTPQASFTLRAEHRWTHENDNPDKFVVVAIVPGTGFPPVSTTGWLASIGGTIKF